MELVLGAGWCRGLETIKGKWQNLQRPYKYVTFTFLQIELFKCEWAVRESKGISRNAS